MMKRKFIKLIAIGAIAIIGMIGYNISMDQGEVDFLFAMKNAEALASEESGTGGVAIGHCGNVVNGCMVKCPKCGTLYEGTSGRQAPAENVRGTCRHSGCGHVFN